ncbi:hypothetical protein D3C71_1947200 [compost metagenome]
MLHCLRVRELGPHKQRNIHVKRAQTLFEVMQAGAQYERRFEPEQIVVIETTGKFSGRAKVAKEQADVRHDVLRAWFCIVAGEVPE